MTDDEMTEAAESDPDNPPLTDAEFATLRVVRRLKAMRERLHTSQDGFARAFGIPVGTLRDWEQGRSVPDTTAASYLKVIERNPAAVRAALADRAEADGPGSAGDAR